MWLLINLSKEYSSEITYQIRYENLPLDKVYKKKPISEIPMTVEATGFKLFAESLSTPEISLDLKALQKKGANYFFLTQNLNTIIQKQLRNGIKLKQIEKDSIIVQLDKLASKNVSLVSNIKMNFQLGYDLAKPVEIIPPTILISGTEDQLKEINELELEEIVLDNVSGSISKTAKIVTPKNSSIKFNKTEATLNLEVDKFTEDEISVPITLKNVPPNVQLNIFPKKVTVTYKVGLSNFNKITNTSFEIVCDYRKALNDNVDFLIPQLKEKPQLISSVRISPNKIDFLINK